MNVVAGLSEDVLLNKSIKPVFFFLKEKETGDLEGEVKEYTDPCRFQEVRWGVVEDMWKCPKLQCQFSQTECWLHLQRAEDFPFSKSTVWEVNEVGQTSFKFSHHNRKGLSRRPWTTHMMVRHFLHYTDGSFDISSIPMSTDYLQ